MVLGTESSRVEPSRVVVIFAIFNMTFSYFAVIVVTFIVIFMKTTTNTTITTRINTLVSTDY